MSTSISDVLPQVQEALGSFLATLLSGDSDLTVGAPSAADIADATIAGGQQLVVVGMERKRAVFAIFVDDQWLPLLSQAMLGEAMGIADEGADDLIRELAAQAYGSVRNALSGEGIKLPEVTYVLSVPGDSLEAKHFPDEPTKVPFSLERDDDTLTGFALIAEPAADGPAQQGAGGGGAKAAGAQKGVPVAPAAFPDLGGEQLMTQLQNPNFGLLAEVELEVTVELGRRQLPLSDVLNLTTGSVIELEKLVGEPLQVYANGRLIAEGEAVVIDEQFGVRITALASARQRAKAFL